MSSILYRGGKIAVSIPEVAMTAYTLYHPFIGLVSWKRKVAVSALYHSLSVAVIAGSIAELLGADDDEIDIATYGGLTHDFYQKGKSATENLTKEVGAKIIDKVLSSEGLDGRVIKEVLESANYNVAENPKIWGSKHPIASLSMWLADSIASSHSALDIYYMLLRKHETLKKLSDEQQKLLEAIASDIVSLTIPQVALRSVMYGIIVNKLRGERFVPIIARGGLVLIRESSSSPIDIPLLEVLEQAKNNTLIEKYINEICSEKRRGESSCRERLEPLLKLSIDKLLCDDAFKNSVFSTPGIKLSIAISSCYETKRMCMICGFPIHGTAFHPGVYGYLLYGKTNVEKWNPRLPAISYEGKNLNRIMQDGWEKLGVVICPLCALDALQMRETFVQNRLRRVDYFIQLYFTLPTHYDLARGIAHIADKAISGELAKSPDMFESAILEDSLENRKQFTENIKELLNEALRQKPSKDTEGWFGSFVRMLDATWTTYLKVVESISELSGENTNFAYYLPLMASTILFTGIYPAKFTRMPDPHREDRLIMPVYPLYDYNLEDKDLGRRTPLIILTLYMVNVIDDDILSLRGKKLSEEDRTRIVLDYIRYPFELHEDLIARRREGRRVFDLYKRFVEDPLSLYA